MTHLYFVCSHFISLFGVRKEIDRFLVHLVYQPKSLIQSCFVRRHWHWLQHRPVLVLALVSVHTSPWHRVIHRNFIFGIPMHICHPHMHIKYLVIPTCSFLVFWNFSLIYYSALRDSHRDFILHLYLCISSLPSYTKEIMPL